MPNIYLLLGPENGQKDDFLAKLKADIESCNGETPEVHIFYPFKTECQELVAILRNTSLFSRHRMVILNQVHEIKKKSDIEAIQSYCKTPADDATLVMQTDLYQVDRRIRDSVPKDKQQIFWELFENKKREWIRSYFQKSGFSVEEEAVELLLDLVENDTKDLRRECERLTLYLAGESAVTEGRVEELIYHSKMENVFTLFDRIARGEFQPSLEILQNLKLSGEADPSSIFSGLLWQFRRLLSVRRLIDRRYSKEDAFRKLNIRGKKIQQTYLRGCEEFAVEQLEALIALIAEYEADLRSGTADLHSIYLQKFLYDATVKKGGVHEHFGGFTR